MKAAWWFLLAAPLCAQQFGHPELTPAEKQEVDAVLPAKAPAKPKKPRKVLITNLARANGRTIAGHPSIPWGNYAFAAMGNKTGAFQVVVNSDPEMFRPATLKQFDAVVFNNTQGVLWEDADLRQSLLDFVNGGGGIAAFHAGGGATFVQYPRYDFWPEFGKIIGGTENGGHPWTFRDKYTFKVDDPKSPLTQVFHGQGREVSDEVFQYQENPLRDHMRVLLSIDMEKTALPEKGVLPVRRADKDFPLTWIKRQGKGRVFVSGLGHNISTYRDPALLAHFLAGLQYVVGDLVADDSPSLEAAK